MPGVTTLWNSVTSEDWDRIPLRLRNFFRFEKEIEYMENEYKETIEILSDEQLTKDLATGIQQIKENKLVDFETLKANVNTSAS